MTSLLADFATAVDRHPDRVAIVDGAGRETTFRQLDDRASSFATAWSAKGIGRGDRVLLAMKVDADLYAALAALWSLGATVVLPEPAMGIAGLRHAVRVAGASAFCSSGWYVLLKFLLPALWFRLHLRPRTSGMSGRPATNVCEDDIALISFTSGTTGAPKAIPRTHRFLLAQHQAVAPLLESEQNERDLVTFPVLVLVNIACGRTSILPNWRMSNLRDLSLKQITDWLHLQNVSRALVRPSICQKLTSGAPPSSLNTIFTGGGPVFPDILDKLTARSPDIHIVCVYGSTEAEPIAHLDVADISNADREKMTAGVGLLVGYPVEEISVRIVDDEIHVAGDHVNKGYLDPAHDAENKIVDGSRIWHRTGDAGSIDDEGRLWLLGRLGSNINIRNGAVFPFSIEVAARHWPGVAQAALMSSQGQALIAIEGDPSSQGIWQDRARTLGIDKVIHVSAIPMDKRHASKIDRVALQKLIR